MKSSIPDLEALSDNSLMAKVRDGDLDRLGLLFERYKKPLYGFFYGLNRQQELSEDLVQNTFLRILKYRHLFRDEPTRGLSGGDFRAWMFQIARNVNNDHHRGNKIKSTEMLQADTHELLSMAMERLPMDKREVLLLSKYQEKKYHEIGEILGCSEGAVKVKVFRALQELKEVYKQLEKQM